MGRENILHLLANVGFLVLLVISSIDLTLSVTFHSGRRHCGFEIVPHRSLLCAQPCLYLRVPDKNIVKIFELHSSSLVGDCDCSILLVTFHVTILSLCSQVVFGIQIINLSIVIINYLCVGVGD